MLLEGPKGDYQFDTSEEEELLADTSENNTPVEIPTTLKKTVVETHVAKSTLPGTNLPKQSFRKTQKSVRFKSKTVVKKVHGTTALGKMFVQRPSRKVLSDNAADSNNAPFSSSIPPQVAHNNRTISMPVTQNISYPSTSSNAEKMRQPLNQRRVDFISLPRNGDVKDSKVANDEHEQDDEIEVLEPETKPQFDSIDFKYDDIEEDEIQFLGEKPLDLQDYDVKPKVEVPTGEPEVINIASDDEDFDDVEIVEEINRNSKNVKRVFYLLFGTLHYC